MSEAIRQLCLLSVLFGVLLSLCPEGSVKKICSVACSAALITAMFTGVTGEGNSIAFPEIARYREQSAALTHSAEENENRLNRLLIEEECEAYIEDKAEKLGFPLSRCRVSVRWEDGFWMPEAVELTGDGDENTRRELEERIEAELGIRRERQTWIE